MARPRLPSPGVPAGGARGALVLAAAGVIVATVLSGKAAAQSCVVEVTGSVSFGSYDPIATGSLDTTGGIRTRCPAAILVARVKIDGGGEGSFPRRMSNGPERLVYDLYLDSSRTTVWGDGTSGTSYLTLAPPSPSFRTDRIYARAPLGQDVAAGSYADVVTVTIEW